MNSQKRNAAQKEEPLDPSTEQHFHIPSAVRNRLDRFESKDVFVALACELLIRKNAHQNFASIPAAYVREAYGKRVHEALKEMDDRGFVNRTPYVAPNATSLQWNAEKGYITDLEAAEMAKNGEGRAYSYKFSEDTLPKKSKWVVWTARREDYHHHTWNAIFHQSKTEWEKASRLEATEDLVEVMDGTENPCWKPLALANRRLTFNWTGETLGRRYTTFGVMESRFRQHFRIDGEPLVELDLTNSVFFHGFGRLNAVSHKLKNPHGYWSRQAESEFEMSLTQGSSLQHYDGSKNSTDYRKHTFLDLDPVIKAVSDEGEIDFYQFIQAHMDGIYEHPTRDFAKTQANTWANSEGYVFYEQNGKRKKNEKRDKLRRELECSLTVGRWTKERKVGIAAMLDDPETGCDMMREEARMVLGSVQPAVESEIGTETLAVHDALYVPESKAREAKAKMKEVYRREYGIAPQIDCE